MSSEEKLEQSNIVKERGTVYFKVSQGQGTPGRPVPMIPATVWTSPEVVT